MARLDEVRKSPHTTLNVRIPETLYQELVWVVEEQDTTMSKLVRQILSDFILHRH